MILLLDCSPEELSAEESDVIETAINVLVDCDRRGHHLVIIERSTADWIVAEISMARMARASIDRIRSRYVQTAGLLKHAGTVLALRTKGAMERPLDDRWHKVCLDVFNSSELHLPSVLLTENGKYDGELYGLFLGVLKNRFGIAGVRFESAHGGGTTIDEQYVSQLNKGRFVVCAIDSDKSTPLCADPKIKKKLDKIAAATEWKFTIRTVLPAREAENLLSPEMLYDIFIGGPGQNTSFRRLMDREKPPH